jgi:hypothetical protein
VFFSLSDWWVAAIVLAIVGGSTLVGYYAGRQARRHSDKLREPFGVLQGALIGVVALILAFGLSLAVGRYEDRRAATVSEANAIGTAYLRAQLTAEPQRSRAIVLFKRYSSLAILIAHEVPSSAAMGTTTAAEDAIQRELWGLGGESITAAPDASAPRLYVDSLNTMFDAQSSRLAALSNRVPGAVLALEVAFSAVALGLLAFHISLLGRGLVPVILAAVMVTLLLLITFDLDRPTRGVIKVPVAPLVQVRASMALPPAAHGP